MRFLLTTAVEFHVQDYVLHMAVLFSPHFSDKEFTEKLLTRLVDIIGIADGEIKTLVMLCFCVLCAIDSESITVPEAKTDVCPRS